MDSRDVKTKYEGPLSLQLMWDKQKELVNHYQKIEGLPSYPINLDTRESQALMKDFVSRVVEELAESHEAHLQGHEWGAIEEIADAFHFILEAMIFTEPNLDSWLKLEQGLQLCDETHQLDGILESVPRYYKEVLRKPDDQLSSLVDWYWSVTYYLNIARNNLRNKPWKQTAILAQKADFKRNIWKGFVTLVQGTHHLNMSSSMIVEQYLNKNTINLFRIKSKY